MALQRSAGNRATTRAVAVLERQPTFGNLSPSDEPMPGAEVVRLEKVTGKWKEIGRKFTRTARGTYDFVVRDGRLWAVKAKRTLGAAGHTEAAQGNRVAFAGQVTFEAGTLKGWNDGSGHFRPAAADPAEPFRKAAIDAGLDKEAFDRHPDSMKRPRPAGENGPQLPVEQPSTRPRSSGEPAKVGPGPPRSGELERDYGRARAVAAELSEQVTFARRMATATQLVHWGLEAWKIYDLVVLVAQAQNMAAATLAEGTPYRRAIDEARRVADKAADTQRQYNALDLRSSMPSHETAPADWDSAYTLFQIQSDFVWIENDLFKARASIAGSIKELKARREQLKKGMEERERALLLPVTSLVHAEAILFASAGREVNDRIDESIASYEDADKAIEMQQQFARAAVKTIETRLRALGDTGRFSNIPDAELHGTPLSGFTMSR
ncbi:MAG TPA: hypothetical protein VJU80_07750 [Solirubrobacteraceae bacterium]|nr:hypothetical protein [Solirubrobacteraceae bacterium]